MKLLIFHILDMKYILAKEVWDGGPYFKPIKTYDSVSELLIFLKNNQDRIDIYNEYGEQHTIEQLKVELIDWVEGQEKRIIDYERVGKIQAPIDHVEISERESDWSWSNVK